MGVKSEIGLMSVGGSGAVFVGCGGSGIFRELFKE